MPDFCDDSQENAKNKTDSFIPYYLLLMNASCFIMCNVRA